MKYFRKYQAHLKDELLLLLEILTDASGDYAKSLNNVHHNPLPTTKVD
jgi:hypothetical protein